MEIDDKKEGKKKRVGLRVEEGKKVSVEKSYGEMIDG